MSQCCSQYACIMLRRIVYSVSLHKRICVVFEANCNQPPAPFGLWPLPPIKSTGNRCIFCCVLLTGPGCFISAIEMLSGRKAVMAGKPGLLIKDFISKRHPLNPERTLMIGDT